jgi:hypothetical protein
MEELTSDEEKGIEILTRNLRKKFPYIKGVKLTKITPYHIYLELIVEFFSFLTFYNVPPTNFYLKYGAKGIKEYFKDRPSSSYIFTMTSDELIDQFSTEFNKNLQKYMYILYSSLPKKYIKFKTDWYEESPMDITIDEFYVIVDESEETPTLRDMLDPSYESARQHLYPTESPD